jgi:hypothetical protein
MDNRFTTWIKSGRSSGNGNCVEIAFADDGSVGVRDSKNPTADLLVFTPAARADFVAGIRAGEFDR